MANLRLADMTDIALARKAARIEKLTEDLKMAKEAAATMEGSAALLPKSVTPGVRTFMATSSGFTAGAINGALPVIPEPVLPLAMFAGGLAVQFADIDPDAAEAASAIADAGGAILGYGVGKKAATEAMGWLRSMSAPQAA